MSHPDLYYPGCVHWLGLRYERDPTSWPSASLIPEVAWYVARTIASEPPTETHDEHVAQLERALEAARLSGIGGGRGVG